MQNLSNHTQNSILLLVLILLSTGVLYGATVTGQIVDAITGNPIADVNVIVYGTSQGTSTDLAGGFHLKVDAIPVNVSISHVSYQSVDVNLSDQSADIKLSPIPVRRSEVVVSTGRAVGNESRSVSNLDRKLVELSYGAQDVPLVAAQTPSATAFSWSGSSVGAATMTRKITTCIGRILLISCPTLMIFRLNVEFPVSCPAVPELVGD